MKRISLYSGVLALILAGCQTQNNSIGPSAFVTTTPGPVNVIYQGIIEAAGPNVLFSPTLVSQVATKFGGPIQYSYGGWSSVVTGLSGGLNMRNSAGAGDPTLGVEVSPHTDILLYGPGSPEPNGLKGIGGPAGDYNNDFFIRWKGHKGPDASLDYSSMSMFFQGTTVVYPLNQYKGFIFFARGTGNFGVAIAANQPNGPYSGYNFYEKVFGPELNGNSQWKQITVVFSEMTQLYGQAADLNTVLSKAWGLQFQQEAPMSPDFQLDVDYVRFF